MKTILFLIVLPAAAFAQEATRLPESAKQTFGVDAGLESAFIARATYAHRVELGSLSDVRLFARATLPVVTPDLGDWSLDGGARATLVRWRDLRVAASIGPCLRNTTNDLYSATGIGAGATILAGYESDRWGLSLEAGAETMLATNIRQSDLYRTTFYAGAKDGWYAPSGGTARAGVRGGFRVGAVEVYGTAGAVTTDELHPVVPPFYLTIGSAYAF